MIKIIFTFVFIFTFGALHAEQNIEPRTKYAMCAASNALLASKMEPGMLADVIISEAKRHKKLAIKAGATQDDIIQVMDAIRKAYNNGEWSWEKISNLGQSCSKVM